MTSPRALLLLGVLALAACARDDESPTAPTGSGGGPEATVLAGTGTWGTRADMPLPIYGASGGTANGKFYSVGGTDSNFVFSDTVLEYTPGTNSWQIMPSLPFPLASIALVTVGTRLYAIGGCDNSYPYDQVLYLRSTGTWATAHPMSTIRCGAVAGNVGGKIYVFGGYGPGYVFLTSGEVYDPSTDHWTPVADIPTFTYGSQGVVLNGKIYVMQQDAGVARMDIYDPGTDSWTSGTPSPDQESGNYVAAVAKGILYELQNADVGPGTSHGFDPATGNWTPVADNPNALYFNGAAAIGGTIYMAGGYNNGDVYSSLLTFAPGATGNHLPTPRFAAPTGAKEGTPVHFDGSASSDPDGDALTYDWDFGDGNTATGATPDHVYSDDGTYYVTLHVSDGIGCLTIAKCTIAKNVKPANVKPSFNPDWFGKTLHAGDFYIANPTFSDADADTWIGTVDYGDGSGLITLSITGKSFALFHQYVTPGVYPVTVSIYDDDGAFRTDSRNVRVNP